ncbi:MAG: GNAT family N-acetyltransferase [Chloroflexota bacterium]
MDPKLANPNLLLRAYRGPEDHPAMNDVANAVRASNGDPDYGTVADMDNYYGHLEHADLPRDCALVELDGRVVAYGRTSWQPMADGTGQVDCVMNVDPGLRGIGIEELLLDQALRRASVLVAAADRTQTTRVMGFATGTDPEQRQRLEARGFVLTRRFAQLIRPALDDIPDLPMPSPFEIRPIDPQDRAMHRRVFEADARAFAGSYGQEATSEALFDAFINAPIFNPSLWRVAFDGETIAGQILNFMDEADDDGTRLGMTEAISVQPEYRRRGLARALLAASLRAVRDAGATRAGLGVDTQNPNEAQTLYEDLGFRVVSEMFEYELRSRLPRPAGNLDTVTTS